MIRSYQFKLYPTAEQERKLLRTLGLCRQLYNAALEQRRFAWRCRGKSVTAYDQGKELKTLKVELPEFATVYAQVLETVLDRLDKAFQGFFRRVRHGETPGYPRFRGFDRFDSFAYRSAGVKYDGRRTHLSKIGCIRTRGWCDLPSPPKRTTVKRLADGWYVTFACDFEPEPKAVLRTGKSVGLDVGLKHFVTTSDGEVFDSHLRVTKAAEKALRAKQKRINRRIRGSRRRERFQRDIARGNLRLSRARKTEMDVLSRQIVRRYDLIAVEDLDISGLLRAPSGSKGLRRNIGLAAWSLLIQLLAYKAEEAGKRLVRVDPRGTTQDCSGCGQRVPKDLRVRVHSCPHCGLVLDRDVNAARNVLQRALRARRGGASMEALLKREGHLSLPPWAA